MRWSLIILLFLMTGCQHVEYVYIPVYSCPAPPTIIMPELSVNRLPEKPEVKDGLKALLEDHVNLRETLKQCITSLEGYKPL